MQDREDNFKSSDNGLSVAKNTYSSHPNIKRKFAEKEMAHLSCYKRNHETECAMEKNESIINTKAANSIELVAHLSCYKRNHETECAMETNESIISTQEENSIELSIMQDIPTSARKEKKTDQLEAEEDMDVFSATPTINVGINAREKQNEPVKSMLVGVVDQAIVKCLEELVIRVIYNLEWESVFTPKALPQSTKQKQPKMQKLMKPKKQKTTMSCNRSQQPILYHGIYIQSNFKNLHGLSFQELVKTYLRKKTKFSKDSKKSHHGFQRMEKLREDFYTISAILDEVGRMNEYYNKDFINKTKEVMRMYSFLENSTDGLKCIQELSSHIITVNNDKGEPCMVNVLVFGSKVHLDLVNLLSDVNELTDKYRTFCLNFHRSSKELFLTPVEQYFTSQNVEFFDKYLNASKRIYRAFFKEHRFKSDFKMLRRNFEVLIRQVQQFVDYVRMLKKQLFTNSS